MKYNKNYIYNNGEEILTKHSKLKIVKQTTKNYKKSKVKAYEYICLNCGNEDCITEGNLKLGKGCGVCCPNPNKVLENVNSIYALDKYFASLFDNIEDSKKLTLHSGKKAILKCPNCGFIHDYRIANVSANGFSCKRCSDGLSIVEKFVNELLLQSKIDFYFHYSGFKWCKNIKHENPKISGNKEYDFYIPSLNTIIEVHGLQHYENKFGTIGSKSRNLTEECENDKIKKQLAEDNGIEHYIIIDGRYSNYDYISNSIKNSGVFKIVENVDFKECYKNSLRSSIVTVCKLYNELKNVNEIHKITKYKHDTIRKWLNKGNEIGICTFDGKYNSSNANSKKIFNSITRTSYNSISEAARLTKISRNKISNMVNDNSNEEWNKI